jgi:hypothetical protein
VHHDPAFSAASLCTKMVELVSPARPGHRDRVPLRQVVQGVIIAVVPELESQIMRVAISAAKAPSPRSGSMPMSPMDAGISRDSMKSMNRRHGEIVVAGA